MFQLEGEVITALLSENMPVNTYNEYPPAENPGHQFEPKRKQSEKSYKCNSREEQDSMKLENKIKIHIGFINTPASLILSPWG